MVMSFSLSWRYIGFSEFFRIFILVYKVDIYIWGDIVKIYYFGSRINGYVCIEKDRQVGKEMGWQ